MYIDNIATEWIDGSYPCNVGQTGSTGPLGTQIYAKYYEIASVDTPLKGPAGLNEFILAPFDQGVSIDNIPPILFNGNEYTYIAILETGVLYFKPWVLVLDSYDAGNPPIPSLFINTVSQNSLQRIYYGLEEEGTQFRLRYEGTNSPDGGVVGSPNIVWELTYYYDTPGQFDIVYGEIAPVEGYPPLNAISSGQGYLGQYDGLANTGYRINPAEMLVTTVNIKGDGFDTGIKDDVLYVDIDPLYPLVLDDDGATTSITCQTLFNIESTALLQFEGTGNTDILTQPFDEILDPNYYGNIATNPGVEFLTKMNNVQLLNVPSYNSSAIPDGPEYLVWVDENNFLRVL